MVGNLISVQPLSLFMQRHGRRSGLLTGAAFGIAGGAISALAVSLESFAMFCLGALPIGAYQASAMYYRFAAQDAVMNSIADVPPPMCWAAVSVLHCWRRL